MAPLSELFPSLNLPLASSRLVGLYFASAWCPDCTPITPLLRDVYNGQSSKTTYPSGGLQGRSKFLEVVYVSSDMNSPQMQMSYQSSHGKWSYVPFSNTEELNSLKRHFGVCAAREAASLDMIGPGRRKSGIPTLVLIDALSEKTVSTHGVDDIAQLRIGALDKWEQLLSTSSSSLQ